MAAALIDTAHTRDLDGLPGTIDEVFALGPHQTWQLVWRLATLTVEALSDGGPRAHAIAAATADTDSYVKLVERLIDTDNGPLPRFVRHWVAIAAPTCTTAEDIVPGEGALAHYRQTVLTGNPMHATIGQAMWLAYSNRADMVDEVYALTRAVHPILNAVGGAPSVSGHRCWAGIINHGAVRSKFTVKQGRRRDPRPPPLRPRAGRRPVTFAP